MTKKNQICNNWYAHVKSDHRSLLTYAQQRRPTLYILLASLQAENREILVPFLYM